MTHLETYVTEPSRTLDDIVNTLRNECDKYITNKHNLLVETISDGKLFVTEFDYINTEVFVDRVTFGDEVNEEFELTREEIQQIEEKF